MISDLSTQPNEKLSAIVDQVWVADDACSAIVGERVLEADHPRELRRLLGMAMYDEFHAGRGMDDAPAPFHFREAGFERLLRDAVPHRTATVPAVILRKPDSAGALMLVEREGVRVWTPPERVLSSDPIAVEDRVSLSVTASRPALSPGFFLVDGSRKVKRTSAVLRVYVNIEDPAEAVPVWQRALQVLEDRKAPYRAKILSAKRFYPRRDAMVLYLYEASSKLMQELVENLAGLPGTAASTSLFTRPVAAGISTAWEPDDPRPMMGGLSFGQHRAGALAQAFIKGVESPGSLMDLITEALTEAGIKVEDLSANLGSPAHPL